MSRGEGFLVVRATDLLFPTGPANYQGIDRVPPYYLDRSQNAAAMDFYVLGDCKDRETNLIPSFDAARKLATRLSQGGARYEVICCCEGPKSPALAAVPEDTVEHLGYDVAGVRGDYWSIVGDFPSSPWADGFRSRLNEHGLFSLRADADEYLRQYTERREPDSNAAFDVVYVARVTA